MQTKLSPRVVMYSWICEVLTLCLFEGLLDVWETLDPGLGVRSIETSGVESPDSPPSSSIACADSALSSTALGIISSVKGLAEACGKGSLGRDRFWEDVDGTTGFRAVGFFRCFVDLWEVVNLAAMVNGVLRVVDSCIRLDSSSLGAIMI